MTRCGRQSDDIASLLAEGELDAAIGKLLEGPAEGRVFLSYLMQQRGDYGESRDVLLGELHRADDDSNAAVEADLRRRISNSQWYDGDLRGALATRSADGTVRADDDSDVGKLRVEIAGLEIAAARRVQIDRASTMVALFGVAAIAWAIWAGVRPRPERKASEQ